MYVLHVHVVTHYCFLHIGISRTALKSIVKEKEAINDEPFTSPSKRYKSSRKRILTDDFDKDAIRRKIYKIYEEKKHVTLSSLLV